MRIVTERACGHGSNHVIGLAYNVNRAKTGDWLGELAAGSRIPKDKRLKQSLFQNRDLCYPMFQAAKFGRRCRSGSGERTAGI